MGKMKRFLDKLKYKYSPTIPDVDYNDAESRRNWILYMAHKTGKMPVREVWDKLYPQVSKVTINYDFKHLEKAGLIKRAKENVGTKKSGTQQQSFVIPLFEDSGEEKVNEYQKRKEYWLNFGLPVVNIILLVLLFAVHLSK